MDNKEHIKAMLQALINGEEDKARDSIHNVIVNKTQEIVSGKNTDNSSSDVEDDS